MNAIRTLLCFSLLLTNLIIALGSCHAKQSFAVSKAAMREPRVPWTQQQPPAMECSLNVRGGGTLPSRQATARFANVFFWIMGITSAADGVRAWEDVDMKVPPNSLAEWCSEHHGWLLLSMSTLACLVERSSLGPSQNVVLSYIPQLYHIFQGIYSRRLSKLGIGSAFGPLLFVYHALLLVVVLVYQVTVPDWMLDGLWWIFSVGGDLFPETAMKLLAGVDTSKTTACDKLMWIIQCHAGLVYAATLRAALSPSPTLETLMKWGATSWLVAMSVVLTLRNPLGRAVGFSDAGRNVFTLLALLMTLFLHYGK